MLSRRCSWEVLGRRVALLNVLLLSLAACGAEGAAPDPVPRGRVPVVQPIASPLLVVPGLEEPVVATKATSATEDRALKQAAAEFRELGDAAHDDDSETLAPFERFVAAYPHSGWSAAVLTNLGLGYYRAGLFSRAFDAWNRAWQEGRGATAPMAKAVVDRAVGELARMHARVGHADELEALFADIGERPVSGSATEAITGAREGAWEMRNNPGDAFLCGPKALGNTLKVLGASPKALAFADAARSGKHGFTLKQVAQLADGTGMTHRLIRRAPGQAIPVPSVINWNVHHYAAITAEENGRYHIQDPTFGGDLVVSRAAIDAEGSGYFLVPAGTVPDAAWRDATEEEAARVYGMGYVTSIDPGTVKDGDQKVSDGDQGLGVTPPEEPTAPSCSGTGMCAPDAHAMSVSLNLNDTPVGYAPQKGPQVYIRLTYNQREDAQPANFAYFNVGPKWTLGVLSYVQDNPASAGAGVSRYAPGGGSITYAGYSSATGRFTGEKQSGAILSRSPATGAATSYTLNQTDGSQLIYGQSDGAISGARRMFLTAIVDPQGNALALAYDSTLRLISITDAAGRVTTFSYGLAATPLLVTAITDPFGRSANLAYDTSGRLASITDVIGIVSSFTYDASGLVNSLTTPYGTSSFTYGNSGANRFLTITDAMGFTERLEFVTDLSSAAADASDPRPTGMATTNSYLNYRNTFFWDKKVYAEFGADYAKAKRWHWLHTPAGALSPTPESIKRPLERRVWYTYVGESNSIVEGTQAAATAIGRVLDDGTTQLTKATYNPLGKLLTVADPVNRITKLTYDTNNVDLTLVQQQLTAAPLTYATLASYTYNTQHEPLTMTDAAGQLWQYGYNAAGQLTSVTDPQLHVTAYSYDTFGRLSTVVNANNATAMTLNYLANCESANPNHVNCDLPQSVTDSEGRTVAYARDALDRVRTVTYPDGTTDQNGYTNLDRTSSTDRLGRTTSYAYDADRRLKSVTDPLLHLVQYGYFPNGALNTLTDQNANVTTWTVDLQSRPKTKTFADGKGITYGYEATTSRLKSTTDALGQVKTLGYNKDNTLASITYAGAVNPTPNVSFTYDPVFPRRTGMNDGNGATTWSYVPVGSPGALAVLTEDGAFGNDAVTYGYDELGRVSSLTAGDTAAEAWHYDAIGRADSHVTGLGTFTYGYLGQTADPTSRALAGTSIGTSWSYDTNANDRRLTAISNSSGARSFTLGYTRFGASGQNPYDITAISQSAAALPAQSVCYQYDEADRLLNVGTPTVPSGGGGSGGAGGGGDSGKTIHGKAEQPHGNGKNNGNKDNCVDGNNGKGNDAKNCPAAGSGGGGGAGGSTGGGAPTCDGSLYAFAPDPAGNLTTFTSASGATNPTYNNLNQITANGTQSFAYDLAGNTTGDGARSYAWDAENRVVQIASGTELTTFRYDGLGRRVEVTFSDGATTNTTRFTWCGASPCAKRDGSDATLARYFAEGQHNPATGAKWVTTGDQLGSVRDVVDATSGTVLASFDYTPYGEIKASSGGITPDYLYAGLYLDQNSGIYYSNTRTYDASVGRWANRDPINEAGGINLYGYVDDEPVSEIDPNGLDSIYINYDYYQVSVGKTKVPLGHGGVVAVNPENGMTRYFEFGRYDPEHRGVVRSLPVPNVTIGKNGLPTQESLDKLYDFLSRNYGHGASVSPTYYENSDYQGTIDYAERFKKKHPDYNLLFNNCKQFGRHAATACEEGKECKK